MFALMSRYKILSLLIILIYVLILASVASIETQDEIIVSGEGDVVLEFYYEDGCSGCEAIKPIIADIEAEFADNITLNRLTIDKSENYDKWKNYKFRNIPSVVIKNKSVNKSSKYYQYSITLLDDNEFEYNESFDYRIVDLNYENLKSEIEYHLNGNYSNQPVNDNSDTKVNTIFGSIDYSKLSLPVLTIILGAADSVNPCSFFVLLFLLSILLHTKSRKRMVLVGGIFIFFSAFVYFLLMVALLNATELIELPIIAIVAGIVAIIFGILNIKDFFFFKKGVSTSISDSQKSELYKQMRKIVKLTTVPSVILATVVLAISANTVELLCSLGLPLVYTGTILPLFNLSGGIDYIYLLFYNLVYIIPLLVIVSIVVITLGRWKLSEFQGQILKLFSGLMILSLGVVLILKIHLLQNIIFSISLLLSSLVITYILSVIWRYGIKKSEEEQKAYGQ
jgi:thiol-disulfide isomerase/thioredoxin